MRNATSSVFTLVLLCCFLLPACDQFSNSDAALKQRLNDTEKKVATLEGTVTELKASKQWDDLAKDSDKIAYLMPGAEGYSTVVFDLGVLTVKLDDVKPYANGSKVTLRFGNVLSSAIDGLTGTIEWGRVNERGFADNSSAKSKEMTFTQTLQEGAWTSVPIVLEGLPPAELGYVRLSKIHHTGIRLRLIR